MLNTVVNYYSILLRIRLWSIEDYIRLMKMLMNSVQTILVNISLAKSTDVRVLHIIDLYLLDYLQLSIPTETFTSLRVLSGILFGRG